MRVLVATDAWRPQINGVVRTYEQLELETRRLGVELGFLTPDEFRTLPCPTYPEIRLAVPGFRRLAEKMRETKPDAVHIATEGPVGCMMRSYCMRRKIPFTTSFHTRFPEYLSSRFRIPESWTYSLQRRFHNAGVGVMVASNSLRRELATRGFERILPWSRGVDVDLFRPREARLFGSEMPVFLYVGRVAVEKNIEAFLRLTLPGRKVVVGTGPQLDTLRRKYHDVIFTGKRTGEDLARHYASADVFVFPSRTDTFGNVLLEAMASGLPVAAFPVTGPIDHVAPGLTGVLSEDLGHACLEALKLDRTAVRRHVADYSWDAAARMFINNIETAVLARQAGRAPAAVGCRARRGAQSTERA
jgi:glycosyltransferase involved in cell wall biosynthesis